MVDVLTARRWLERGEAILLDVRQPEESEAKRIPGAYLLPLAEVAVNKLPPYEGKKCIIHCAVGGRSGMACKLLRNELPGIEVYNLEGGIVAWENAGLPVITR